MFEYCDRNKVHTTQQHELLLLVLLLGLVPDTVADSRARLGFSLIAPLAPPIVEGISNVLFSMRLSALRAIS
jgi:hypothetical protein